MPEKVVMEMSWKREIGATSPAAGKNFLGGLTTGRAFRKVRPVFGKHAMQRKVQFWWWCGFDDRRRGSARPETVK